MADRRKELDRLRKSVQSRAQEEAEKSERRSKELRMIREAAEHTNRCRNRTVFVIDEDGVYSAHDGKPIVDYHQTLADEWYFDFLGWGANPRGLLHDPEAYAFYLPDPPYLMAFSRDRCPLAVFFWAFGDNRSYTRGQFGPERLDPERAEELEPWGLIDYEEDDEC